MIIHRGRGGLIAFIVFLCLGAADLYTQMHESNQPASPTHSWPNLVACLAAAFLVWWLSPQTKARAMESDEKRAWMVSSSQDVAANESEPSSFRLAYFRETDSCFFIPVQYWPTLLCTLGLVLYYLPHLKLPALLR